MLKKTTYFAIGRLTVILVLFVSCLSATSLQGVGYSEIGDSVISSFGIVEPMKAEESYEMSAKDKAKPKIQIATFTPQQLREKTFTLLAKNDVQGSQDSRVVSTRTTLKDLDVYLGRGQTPQAHLLNAIDNTVTYIGQAGLAHMLAHPLINKTDLNSRQELVKELVSNPELLAQAEAILQKAKKSEQLFFSFWQKDDQITADYIKGLYWNNKLTKNLNESAAGLEFGARLGNLHTHLT